MHDPFWSFFNGALGVTMFFGISGFLITTLLLREEDREGRVSLKNFYIRRMFRIVPLYFIALGATTVLVLGFGQGAGGEDFLRRLPLLVTFNGEFAGSGTFSHSWSLGIEEKFYVVWPLLAFAVPAIRSRLAQVLAFALPLVMAASFIPWSGYFGIYAPIVGGCALAVAMHHRRSYRFVRHLANPWLAAALFISVFLFSAIEATQPIQDHSKYAHVAFGALVLLAMPGLLVRSGWPKRLLSLEPIVFYGNLAYAIYLFHPFVGEVIDRVVGPGQTSPLLVAGRFAAMLVVSFGVALLLRVAVEQPFIRMGRRLTSRERPPLRVPAGRTTAARGEMGA